MIIFQHIAGQTENRLSLIRKMSGGSLDPVSMREMAELALRVASLLHKELHSHLLNEVKRPAGYTFLD